MLGRLIDVRSGEWRRLAPLSVAYALSAASDEDAVEIGALQAVMSSPILRQMAGMAGIVAVIAAIADVQFNQIADVGPPLDHPADLVRSVVSSTGLDSAFARAQLARMLDMFATADLRDFVDVLKTDSDDEVVRATMLSLGQLGDLSHVPWLIEQLSVHAHRVEARLRLRWQKPTTFLARGRCLTMSRWSSPRRHRDPPGC